LGFHDGGGYDVFRGDQLDFLALTAQFGGDGRGDFGVARFQLFGKNLSSRNEAFMGQVPDL